MDNKNLRVIRLAYKNLVSTSATRVFEYEKLRDVKLMKKLFIIISHVLDCVHAVCAREK
jgi:hypothetical protein